MKIQRYWIASFLGASLLVAGGVQAQTQPMQPPPPPDAQNVPPPPDPQNAPPPPPPAGAPNSATMGSPMGDQTTIHSTMGTASTPPPPPPFSSLSGGKGFITKGEASSYPPLANDFDYADSNRDGRISKAEYQRWLQQAN